MKSILTKLLKAILIFLLSTIIIYSTLTIKYLCNWCSEMQVNIFSHEDNIYYLDDEKVNELGNSIRVQAELFEEAGKESPYKNNINGHSFNDGHSHSFTDFYDSLGIVLWQNLQSLVWQISEMYINISIFLGIAISFAYIIVTNKKINSILKIIIAYLGILVVVPPLYMYSWSGRFWEITRMYARMPKYFYIIYTIIFILMYITNFIIGKLLAKKLNHAIKGEQK